MRRLSAAERALWDAYPRGEQVDLEPDRPHVDRPEPGSPALDSPGPDSPGPDSPEPGPGGAGGPGGNDGDGDGDGDGGDEKRTVRASVIAEMLLGGRTTEPGRVPGLRLRGARITGTLDLSHGHIAGPVVFRRCRFDAAPVLADATVPTVEIIDCRLPGLDARRLRTDGMFVLTGSDVTDSVELADARVGGTLVLTDSRFAAGHGRAVNAQRSRVEGNFEAFGISVDGEVAIYNAYVAGSLHLSGARLRNPGALALSAGGLVVDGGFFCLHGFSAEGQLRLVGARLGANLTFRDATLRQPDRTVLLLDRASIGTIDARHRFHCEGEIRLVGTQVAGQVNLSDARLDGGTTGHALTADAAGIGDELLLSRVHATGGVRLRMTQITGRLHLWNARLSNPGDIALRASRSVIGSDVFAAGLEADGEVRFSGARIGARLDLSGVRLSNPGGTALSANPLVVTRLDLLPAHPVEGGVDLRHAQVGVLRDDPGAWPSESRLDGLTYQALEPRLRARERLRWLDGDPDGYQPQPYEQLAAEYGRIGQHADARRVLHAKERRQRTGLTPFGRAWNLLQDVTVAYGYQPWRAALWLVMLLAVGSAVYGTRPPPPLRPDEAPHFNPVIYTLDLLLPLVDLGQKHAFNPAGGLQWLSYVFVASGWVLATTIAAGVARVLTRK